MNVRTISKIDREIKISIGKSRKETSWQNKKISWSEFVKKLSKTQRTVETYSEYLSFPKARQDEIKDVGGFVGGTLTGGKRSYNSVTERHLITLDADFGDLGLWDIFVDKYNCAGVLYTTHKHCKKTPRYRLVIPLVEPVSKEEYEAIARYVANDLDINAFDDTTYQPERLMYWASTSCDGEYVFKENKGIFLNGKEVLTQYDDWQNISNWARSDRTLNLVQRNIKKQGNPLEKPYWIGAFCNTYGITDVINTFLSDIYTPCDDNRYTYAEGSTTGGLIIYDDLFAYSHHGTDPISSKLCNAFDLVRIHKFRHLDDESHVKTNIDKLPSFKAMSEFCANDKNTTEILSKLKLKEIVDDFDDVNFAWLHKLEYTLKGEIKNTIENAHIVILNDPVLKDKFGFNEFSRRASITGLLPWSKTCDSCGVLADADIDNLYRYIERHYKISNLTKIKKGLNTALQENSFNPVKDYINGVKWDSVGRLDTLFIDYLGAEDTELNRAITRKTLVAAVNRIFKPGCKFDYVLILAGSQGIGKSTIIKKLGRDWFSDSLDSVTGKDAYEQIQGVWILELGELAGLKRSEMNQIKHFISKQEDMYRVAYGEVTSNFPRQCIFIGTTNDYDFLKDPTGNRRFWPLDVGVEKPKKSVFADLTDDVINQIWAEAVEHYKKGETIHLEGHLVEKISEIQEEHRLTDEKEGIIVNFLDLELPVDWDNMDIIDRRNFIHNKDYRKETLERCKNITFVRDKICIPEIWCELFKLEFKDLTPWKTREFANILRNIPTFEEKKDGDMGRQRFKIYGRQKTFVRKSDNHGVPL